MKFNKRDFLKITGLTVLGITARPASRLLAGDKNPPPSLKEKPADEALIGKRWAMVVDMSKCRGEDCSDCINACHIYHNVPHFDNVKDEIKWIWKEPFEHAFPSQQHEYMPRREAPFIVLCNHCDNPPCVRVCPTKATWQREDGIVMMDMHRCIGCRFCMAACPYGSRSFNWRPPRPHIEKLNPNYPTRTIGVVEKCTFCAERLALGKPPVCVEACREGALIFGDLNDENSEVRKIVESAYTIRRKPELGTLPQVFYLL